MLRLVAPCLFGLAALSLSSGVAAASVPITDEVRALRAQQRAFNKQFERRVGCLQKLRKASRKAGKMRPGPKRDLALQRLDKRRAACPATPAGGIGLLGGTGTGVYVPPAPSIVVKGHIRTNPRTNTCRALFAKLVPSLEDCYASALERQPRLNGMVFVRMFWTPDKNRRGVLQYVRASFGREQHPLAQCVLRVLKKSPGCAPGKRVEVRTRFERR